MGVAVGSARAEPGRRTTGVLEVGQTADGAPISVPVIIVAGRTPGPTVWIQAGVHGTELTGIVAVMELARGLDPAALAGTVVALPLANVTAFRRWHRFSDLDWMDINRVFPGRGDGSFSERTAKVLGDAVLAQANCFVDVHNASDPRLCALQVIYREGAGAASTASKRLAMSVGWEAVWGSTDAVLVRSLLGVATARGVPSVIIEAGAGEPDAEYLPAIRDGLRNVLVAAGLLEGAVPRLPSYLLLDTWSNLYAGAGGLCRPTVAIGSVVERGAPLVQILNLYGDVVEEIRAPFGPAFVRTLIRPYHPAATGQMVAALLEIKGREAYPE